MKKFIKDWWVYYSVYFSGIGLTVIFLTAKEDVTPIEFIILVGGSIGLASIAQIITLIKK